MSDLVIPSPFRSVTGLGEPIHVYTQSGLSKAVNVIVGAVFLLLAVGTAYCGLAVYPQMFPEVAGAKVSLILGFCGLVLLGTLYWASRTFSRWKEAAVVYHNGFAHFSGREVCVFRWNEVASITMHVSRLDYSGIPIGTERKYTITNQLGDQLKLDNTLSKVEELFGQIRRNVFPYILARTQRVFDAGQSVEFGSIAISKAEGVQKGNKSYTWDNIARISVVDGFVQVKPQKRGLFSGFTVPVENVPNVDVFVAIATDMVNRYAQIS